MSSTDKVIDRIIRDIAAIERDRLPGQPCGEMRITAGELRAILEARLDTTGLFRILEERGVRRPRLDPWLS